MKEPILENLGYCIICDDHTKFIAHHEWLRDFYLCEKCGTCPRQRSIVEVLNWVRPNWRDLNIHESSPCIRYFAEQCKGYTDSFYFEDVELGTIIDGSRCENLECLTFEDETFDILITQDVMEHVFHPDKAFEEIVRVLKTGGIYIFTAPKHKSIMKSYPRAKIENGIIRHLLPPDYHGNPIADGKSLVTWDYGTDFDDLIRNWSGYNVSNYVIRDRNRGIDGEFLEVFVLSKDRVNKI